MGGFLEDEFCVFVVIFWGVVVVGMVGVIKVIIKSFYEVYGIFIVEVNGQGLWVFN